MPVLLFLLCLVLAIDAGVSHAQVFPGVERYVATNGSNTNCEAAEDIATPALTFAFVVNCTSAGDTIWIRAGTYTQQLNLQDAGKSGTSTAWIKVAGYPGERPVIRFTDPGVYGAVKARGNRGYFLFENFVIDAINQPPDSGWSIRDGNHDFIIRNLEYKNGHQTAFYIHAAPNVVIANNYIHEFRSTCADLDRSYGIYAHHGTNLLIENNEIYDMPGGGIQTYPGPWNGIIIRNNNVHENAWCPTTNVGGILTKAGSGNITNLEVYNNRSWSNAGDGEGWGAGFTFEATGSFTINGKAYNNVSYNNQFGSNGHAWGYNVQGANVTLDLKNNIAFGNESGSVTTGGSPTLTRTHNACPTAHSSQCGATGFVALTAITDCLLSTTDHRLKNGTNPCRNAGTSVSTRPSPVGVTDIGSYEQPEISSASIDSATMELVVSTGGLDLSPTSGLTGVTPACSGHASCGTPVVSATNLKAGSNVTVQVVLSGIGGGGNCALTQTWVVTLSAVNFGAGYVGTSDSSVQGVNDASNFGVTEICTGSGGSPPAGMIAHYKFNSSNGTDSSGNGNTATISAGVTFSTVFEGMGARIPTDATFNHVDITALGPLNPSSADFGTCAVVKPDIQYSSKVVASFGGNGTGQRTYYGFIVVNGQLVWGIGAGSSGFSTGSEFPVTGQLTFVCMIGDATADTITLWVNGVKGTGTGTSVKSVGSFTTVDNLRYGNDGTFTTNNGGFDIDEVYVWNTKPTDQDIIDLYASLFDAGSPTACYEQKTHKPEGVYLLNGIPEARGTSGAAISVVAGGAVAELFQFDCTGSAGAGVSFKFYYSTDGINFDLELPTMLGAAGIALWGSSTDSSLNSGTATCCITGALTQNNGTTLIASATSPTVTLSQNHSVTIRVIIRVASDKAGSTFYVKAKQDNGVELAGGSTPSTGAQINVIPAQASAGF